MGRYLDILRKAETMARYKNSPRRPLGREMVLPGRPPTADMEVVHRTYAVAVQEVGTRWDALVAAGKPAPLPAPEEEEVLNDAMAEKVKAGDVTGALQAIEAWKRSWMVLLSPGA